MAYLATVPPRILMTAMDTTIKAWEVYDTIQGNKKDCKNLIRRCEALLGELADLIKVNHTLQVADNITSVENACFSVKYAVDKVKSGGRFARILHRNEITEAMKNAEAKLADALALFNIKAHLESQQLQAAVVAEIKQEIAILEEKLDMIISGERKYILDAVHRRVDELFVPLTKYLEERQTLLIAQTTLKPEEEEIKPITSFLETMKPKGSPGAPSTLVKTLSPLLFSAPNIHFRSLESMWVDGLINHAVWKHSMEKLNSEWQEFILYATVLLNANVAFLAIEPVQQHQNPYHSPAQISSYLSTVTSIGSIILGLLLIRQNWTRARDTTNDALYFLNQRKNPILGLESLAIMFSLPYALLMWAMFGFLAAFSFMCLETFYNTTVGTMMAIGSWGAIVILTVWYMAWEKKPSDKYPGTDNTWLTALSEIESEPCLR